MELLHGSSTVPVSCDSLSHGKSVFIIMVVRVPGNVVNKGEQDMLMLTRYADVSGPSN